MRTKNWGGYRMIVSFIDLLDKQAELESKINHIRERTTEDICTSMLAELIEFQEETQESHKTWKVKEYDQAAMKEEAVDILFFYLQYCLDLGEVDKLKLESYWRWNWKQKQAKYSRGRTIFALIRTIVESEGYREQKAIFMMNYLVTLYQQYEITLDEVYAIYEDKYNKNLQRIGSEWN